MWKTIEGKNHGEKSSWIYYPNPSSNKNRITIGFMGYNLKEATTP